MYKLLLLIATYYLQISWHDMNLKFTLGLQFDKWSWSMNLSTWSRDFFYKWVLVSKFYTVLLPNILRPNINFVAGVKDDISTTIQKILETNSSFYTTQRTTGKVEFLFFSSFKLILTKFSFWQEDQALGYNSMKF